MPLSTASRISNAATTAPSGRISTFRRWPDIFSMRWPQRCISSKYILLLGTAVWMRMTCGAAWVAPAAVRASAPSALPSHFFQCIMSVPPPRRTWSGFMVFASTRPPDPAARTGPARCRIRLPPRRAADNRAGAAIRPENAENGTARHETVPLSAESVAHRLDRQRHLSRPERFVHIGLVFVEQAHRLLERIAPERVAQFLADHHLQHGGLALGLGLAGRAQRVANLVGMLDPYALHAHGARQLGEVRVLQVAADEAPSIEVDLVLLLGAPLAIVEHHRGDRDFLARAGQQFLETHAPGAIAHVGDRRPVGAAQLGADQGGQRIAAVAEAHGGQHRIRLPEAQIAVGYRADIADVGRHHHMVRHGALQLAQHAARMHAAAAARDDVQAPVVALVRPAVQLLLPLLLFLRDAGAALLAVAQAGRLRRG